MPVPLESRSSETGEVLQFVFSATHYLLDILLSLQRENDATRIPGMGLWADLTAGPVYSAQVSNDHMTTYFNQIRPSISCTNGLSDCSSTITQDLVIACHTHVLNIHATMLGALQHDAVLKTHHPISEKAHVKDDTRFALTVQLCAYLLERQRQAVHSFLAPRSAPPSMSAHAAFSTSDRVIMNHLEVDVQQRLAQIRQILRI